MFYTVTVQIDVTDPAALRAAAGARWMAQTGESFEDYLVFLDNGHDPVADDLVTMLDPGRDLPGCSVQLTSAEPMADAKQEGV